MVKMYCELMERATVEPTAAYLAHEAGLLAGVPGDRVGQWARWGHIRASVSAGEPHVYAFADVAEALAVHLLLEAGFKLPFVRRAVERLGGAVAWPLSDGRLHVVDHRLAVERGGVLKDVFTEQTVLHGLAALVNVTTGFAGVDSDGRVTALDLLRRGGWPARLTGDLTSVEVDPARVGGRAHLRGRRLPVEDVVAVDDPEREFELSPDEVAAAGTWWAAAMTAES
jgi:hypothetical protein